MKIEGAPQVWWFMLVAVVGAGGESSDPDAGYRYSTPLSEVSSSFATFSAARHAHFGLHRGHMSTVIPVGGETLTLSTRPDKTLFTPNSRFHAYTEDGVVDVDIDLDIFHVGKIEGEFESHVHLSLHHTGAIEGTIYRANGDVYIFEAMARYPLLSDVPDHHDTVIYHRDSLTSKALHGLGSHGSSCPVHGLHGTEKNTTYGRLAGLNIESPPIESIMHSMQRRSDPINCLKDISDHKCSCDVALVGDYEYFKGPNCNGNLALGIQTIIRLVVNTNKIYRSTNFGGMTGLGFVVDSVRIYTSRKAPGNPTPYSHYSSGSSFLSSLTSGLQKNFTDVCSSMLFTHRDFQEGILGMAWVASSQGYYLSSLISYGGICDPKYNCGFNTGINFGVEVTPFVQSLVFAHEIGHNCGAEHDPEDSPSCSPGNENGAQGNYIMFAAATDGTHPNNHRFSSCSTAQMGRVMGYLRSACFVEAGLDDCGNGIVDGDEECDCGSDCSPTSCCTSTCRVNTAMGKQCSPQNPLRFPCCTTQCTFKQRGTLCHDDDDCAEDAYCSGNSAVCPLTPKANSTACHCLNDDCSAHPGTNPQVCVKGVCDSFVCELYGAVQCGLPHPDTCVLGCRGPGFGDGQSCISTFSSSSDLPYNFSGGRLLFPGTPCLNSKGMCDRAGDCILMSVDDAPKAKSWTAEAIDQHWQELAVIGAALLVALVIFAQYKIRQKRLETRAKAEREYLLAAANEEFDSMADWSDDDTSNEYAGGTY